MNKELYYCYNCGAAFPSKDYLGAGLCYDCRETCRGCFNYFTLDELDNDWLCDRCGKRPCEACDKMVVGRDMKDPAKPVAR